MDKPTLATLKSFIKNNQDNLYVKKTSDFDGMVDCVMPVKDNYIKVDSINFLEKHTLGISGVWLVGSSRDYITTLKKGYEVYNCCGTFELVTK